MIPKEKLVTALALLDYSRVNGYTLPPGFGFLIQDAVTGVLLQVCKFLASDNLARIFASIGQHSGKVVKLGRCVRLAGKVKVRDQGARCGILGGKVVRPGPKFGGVIVPGAAFQFGAGGCILGAGAKVSISGLQIEGGALRPFPGCDKGGLLFGFRVEGAKIVKPGGGILGGYGFPVAADPQHASAQKGFQPGQVVKPAQGGQGLACLQFYKFAVYPGFFAGVPFVPVARQPGGAGGIFQHLAAKIIRGGFLTAKHPNK